MYTNVFYQSHINIIGGIETFLYELARLAQKNNRDLTIVYGTGDPKQIERIRKYCRIVALKDIEKPIKCKTAFFNYNIDPIDLFEAEEYIQFIHADYASPHLTGWLATQLNTKAEKKITKRYAVSASNARSYKLMTGKEAEVLYNPIYIDEEPRVMTLIAAQRFTPEKGGKRTEELIERLDSLGVPYVFHIFSDKRLNTKSENVMYHKPTLDIRRWVKYADYTVLLSDTEGFPYGAYESLCMNVPVIITELPMLDELGCNEDNSIVVKFDMSNLDVKEIYEKAGKFKFEYEPKPDGWLDLLPGESTYKYVPPKTRKIKAKIRFKDILLDKIVDQGFVYEVEVKRAEDLVKKGLVDYYE